MKYICKHVKQSRPSCANWGCNKPVAHSGKRWRPVCGSCHKIGYTKGVYPQGIRPFKTGVCSNAAGGLGWLCPIDYNKNPWARGLTQIDHKDRNPLNNDPSNLNELCALCHQHKGMLNGDFR
jgi:hypothetical protein